MAHVPNYYTDPPFGSKRHCGRCGFLTPRRQLVRDGFTMAMVCSKCWNPPEEPDLVIVPTQLEEPT